MTMTKMRTAAVLTVAAALACLLLMAGCSSNSASSGSASAASASSSSASSSAASSSAASSSTSASTAGDYTKSVDASDPYGHGIHHAVMTIEGYGPVTIELDADQAPVTVANFCKLANEGFYNGLNFYRFVDGFCMQGGSSNNSAAPAADGLTPILGEFSSNGVDNALADNFQKGTVAMARSSNPNSAGSTFFVTLDSGPMVAQSLDGQYAAFGTIDESGMAVIDQVVADYLPKVTEPQMGAIEDEAQQAKITSIQIVD